MSLTLSEVLSSDLPPGPQGPQGPTGATGPQGPQGPQGPSGPIFNLTVEEVYASNNQVGNTVSNINKIQFDLESAFNTVDQTSGTVRIVTSSTFKYWEVDGILKLTAIGLDTINFRSGDNVVIEANPSTEPQSIRFSVPNVDLKVAKTGDTMTGNLVTTNVAPSSDNIYDLGSPSAKYKKIYLGSDGLRIGAANLSFDGSSIVTDYPIASNVSYVGPSVTVAGSVATTSDSEVVLDSFQTSDYITVKYVIQAKSIEGIHSTELFCMHDGINVYTTEYAVLINQYTLGVFSVVIESGVCKLKFFPDNDNNNLITIRFLRQALES